MSWMPTSFSPRWDDDRRPDPPLVGDERTLLTAYLDFHRHTFELKCAGLSPQQLSSRSLPPSALSLHGLVRHLAGVERWWFRIQYAGERVPLLYYSDDEPNLDFDDLSGDVAEVFTVWHEECRRAREIVAGAASLDETRPLRSNDRPVSLRRVVLHLLAEYARHNGHADLLRERLDGATGY